MSLSTKGVTNQILAAVTDVSDNTTLGTGSYLVWLKLSKRMPNWVPMFGMKVKLSYKGVRAA